METKVLDEFGEKVASIVRGALEVRKVIGEEMATTDFEVFCPRYGQRFVADMMEDMDGPSARDGTSESSKSNDVILMMLLNVLYMPSSDLKPIGAMNLLRIFDLVARVIQISFSSLPNCTAISAQPTRYIRTRLVSHLEEIRT